jgi:hypothetical protein
VSYPAFFAAAATGSFSDAPVVWSGVVFAEASNVSPVPHIYSIGLAALSGGSVVANKRLRVATPKEATRFGYSVRYAPDGRLWVLTFRSSDSTPWPQYLCHFSDATLAAAASGASVTPDIQVTLPSSANGGPSLAFAPNGDAWITGTETSFLLSKVSAAHLVAGTLVSYDTSIALKSGISSSPSDLAFASNGDCFVAMSFNGAGCGIAWLQAAQIASSTADETTSTLIPYKQIGLRNSITANKRGCYGIALDPAGDGVWVTGIQVAGGNGPAIYRYAFSKFDGNGTNTPPAACSDPTPDVALTCATSGAFDSPMSPRFDSDGRLYWANRWVDVTGAAGPKLYSGGRLLPAQLATSGTVTAEKLYGSPATPGGNFDLTTR